VSLGGGAGATQDLKEVVERYPAIHCGVSAGNETISFIGHVDSGANVSAISDVVYGKLPPGSKELQECAADWKITQADKSELAIVGQDTINVSFDGGGDLRVPLLVVRGLAADMLLGTEFMEEHDVCITSKDRYTGVKKIIFEKEGWAFPFVEGRHDPGEAVARLLLSQDLEARAARVAKSRSQDVRLDESILVPSEDPQLMDVPTEVDAQIIEEQEHFLGHTPLYGGGQGRHPT
jgi:hypothetical protein